MIACYNKNTVNNERATMPLILSIFDFDQTLTKGNTPSSAYRPNEPNRSYQAGRKMAFLQAKKNIEKYLVHNEEQISAIATYHNNPAYIAGFVSTLLRKDLIFNETIVLPESPPIAIDIYKVTGQEHPFLISYIPDVAFSKTVSELQETGKNKQLSHLEQVIKEKKILPSDSKAKVNFYDGTEKNCSQAIQHPLINNSYQVDTQSHDFKTISVKRKLKLHCSSSVLPPQPQEGLSSSLFLRMMSSPASKVIGGLLLLGGLAAIGFVASGATGVGFGVGLGLMTGCFFTRYTKPKQPTTDAPISHNILTN